MSKKILIISGVLLLVGTSLVPGGILIEDYINELVVNSVDDGLLRIEKDAIPLIEPMIKEKGIPQTLRGIRDTAIPLIEPMIKEKGIPQTLRGIRDTAIPLIEPFIKEKGIPQTLRGIRDIGISFVEDMVEATFVAVLVEVMAIEGGTISSLFFPPIGIETFFNNDTTGVWVLFSGISRYHIEPLNYTEDAQNRILVGNSTTVSGYISGIQGFLNDTSTGAGVQTFLEQYHSANSSETNELKDVMQENYNCTWYQMTKLYEYVDEYLIHNVIPLIISLNLHVEYMPSLSGLLSVNDIARALFMEQWANGTILEEVLYPGGIDFSEILEDVNETLIGFEIGRLVPSNITREASYALFDEFNYPNALTNDTGIKQWITANTNNTVKDILRNEFNLTQIQMDMILYWLFDESFQDDIVPELMKLPPPEGIGKNITDFAKQLLLEQWANGTILTEVLYPGGIDFSEMLEGVNDTLVGFEVGRLIPSNITLKTALALFDEFNYLNALTNDNGIERWILALSNNITENLLMNEFNLTQSQINMILYWLFEESFQENFVPELMKLPPPDGVGKNISAFAKDLLLEQWANGTILGEVIYPGGIDFSEILEGVDKTLVGFEVGRETPSGIILKTASALFDEINYQNALTNDFGIEQWIFALINDTVRDSLMNEFTLEKTQIDLILYWLFEESFQENIVPELMKLPPPNGVGMNITEYARVLFLEQWANGTVDGEILYPHGFPLSLKAGIIYGFEVGYQGKDLPVLPTNMSLESAESLWDVKNENSLVNNNGLKKWYSALANPTSTLAAELQSINSLQDRAMDMILDWLSKFRNNVMPYLAQEDRNLPMDSKSYGNTIELGMVITGGILMGLGLFGLASNIYMKRKLNLLE
ncbi:MAG: hypothetical protein ACFFG0_29155 [Candidatus Thorarchaeota archaeon]